MSTERLRRDWIYAGSAVGIVLLILLLMYQQTVLYLIGIWNKVEVGEYAHGYVVLLISGYLLFNNRQKLMRLTPCSEYKAIFAVVAMSLVWLMAALVDVQVLQAISLLLLIFATLWSILGSQVMKYIAFPILFISFAVPVWNPLSPLLQNITADAVYGVIRLLAVPAARQDNVIVLPAGKLSIEEACSGLRYLLAAMTLGTLYAYMYYSSWKSRIIVVMVSVGAAVLSNIIRVFIVVYLGYATDMQHPLVNDHLSLGWYIFAGMVFILMLADAKVNKNEAAENNFQNIEEKEVVVARCRYKLTNQAIVLVSVIVLASAAPLVQSKVNHRDFDKSVIAVPEMPKEVNGWLITKTVNNDWIPEYRGAVNLKQYYKKNDKEVAFYVGFYPVQKQGVELINELNYIGVKERWNTVYPKDQVLNIGKHKILEQLIENKDKKQKLVWYWYNVAGMVTTNKYEAKIMQIIGLISGKDWAYIAAVAYDNNERSRDIMNEFIEAVEVPMKREIERINLKNN
ncbi:MAG: EpsI family protein [Gammaproteobacteria bacterium]|nr:EpsI family protein [Gammaproteobacteria bacterium]